MIKRILLCLMAAMLFLPAAALAEGTNLLVNPGFEELGEDGLPTGWYTDAYINRLGVTLYSASTESKSGEHAATVENCDLNDARFAQVVRVQPSTMYRLSGWIKASDILDAGHGANLSVEGVHARTEGLYDTDGEWVYVETYGITGDDQTEVTIFARVGGYSGESQGTAAFDDLALEVVEDLPEGVYAKAWYVVESVPVVDPVTETDSDEAQPAWPLLIGIGCLYAAAGWWLMRHFQLDRRADAMREASAKATRMPLFAVIGLCIAAIARIVVALQVDGYQVDVNCFTAWGNTMSSVGPTMFYQSNWCDYTPGYIYIMGLNGLVSKLLNGVVSAAFVHKLIPMTCDLIGAWLIYRLAVEHEYSRRQGGLLALLFSFNPAIFLNSAAWCQIDSVLCIGLMLVAYFALHRKWSLVLPVYVLCVLVKPQALMLGFLGLAAIIMELVKHRSDKQLWKQMGIGLLFSLVLALLIIIPFCPNQESPLWLIDLYKDTLASYPYATVNTANLYYLADGNWDGIANPANDVVCIVLLLMAIAWAAYSYIRRKDRLITVIEPVLTALMTLLLVCIALLGTSWGRFEAPFFERLQLTMADSYSLVSKGLTITITGSGLAIAGALLLAASTYLIVLLIGKRRWCSGLVETVLMGLFALAFAGMLVFDTSWTTLGIVAMAMAFALILPMFIRSGKLEDLPLCGAVLFILLYVFGIKMHERYLFPALFLLGMAYAIRRDRRTLLLLVGTSCVLFVNEGIVLDNSLRLGSSMGHLNNDTLVLANFLSLLNVAFALFSVWTCRRVCCEDAPVRLTETLGEAVGPVRQHEAHPCNPLSYKPDAHLRLTRKDALLMLVVTAIYSLVTLTTLGSTKAPQTSWTSTSKDERVYIDLGQHYDDFSMLYFSEVSYSNFSVAVSNDLQFAVDTSNQSADDGWSEEYFAEMREGLCFSWQYLDMSYTQNGTVKFVSATDFGSVQKMSGRYVRINPRQAGLILNEVIFKDAEGNIIPNVSIVSQENANENSPLYSDPNHLVDEQDTLDGGEPHWWNSTYFDEIYHARTAFEHANATTAYEWTHPPLGKIIMSWFISLFGMTPFGWRFAGALCGILMLPAMYLLVKQLTKRTDMAFTAMMLMTLDCMHFTQTRLATIDSYPVLFIILSYFFMLRFMQRDIVVEDVKKVLPDLALSGFFMGCSIASKWIGVYAGVGLAVLYFWTCFRHLRLSKLSAQLQNDGNAYTAEQRQLLDKRQNETFKRIVVLCLWCLLFFVTVPVVIYLWSYTVHYNYMDFDSIGDFLKTVINCQENMINYHGEPGRGMDHSFYSPWYEWPLMVTPMYYASAAFKPEGMTYAIFCFGNPWVWLVGLVGIAYAVYRWARGHRYALKGSDGTFQLYRDDWDVAPAFILIGLLAQFLPWLLVPRGTYIYHYFASVPFLILGTTLMLHYITKQHPRRGRKLLIGYLVLCLVWFILLFPYASGLMTSEKWMAFIRDYPYISSIEGYWQNDFLMTLNSLLEKIPIFPHVYFH